MTVATDYTSLQTAIQEDLARTDLSAELPNFIQKGEANLNRRLRLLSMETTASVTLSSSAETASLPSGFLEDITLRYTSNNELLSSIPASSLDAIKSTTSGKPRYYTIGSSIEFERPSDSTYTLTHRYFKKWDIATDDTNTLLTDNPDVYLYAGLVAALTRTGNHPRGELWARELERAIMGLQKVDARTRRRGHLSVDRALQGASSYWYDINRGY